MEPARTRCGWHLRGFCLGWGNTNSTGLFPANPPLGSTQPVCDPVPAVPLHSTPAIDRVYAATVPPPTAASGDRSHSSEILPLHPHPITQPECTIYLSWRLFPRDPRQALLCLTGCSPTRATTLRAFLCSHSCTLAANWKCRGPR